MKKFAALMLSVLLAVSALPAIAQQAGSVTVTVVVAGAMGDLALNDSTAEGLDRLITELQAKGKVVECGEDASQYSAMLLSAAGESDYVAVVGAGLMDAVQEVAPTVPDKKFIYVDQTLKGIPNLVSVQFSVNEGSFLAGYVAGKLSRVHKVGAVGRENVQASNNYMVGFRQGARYANSATGVESIYAGKEEDPAKGVASATLLLGRGCDILFSVAGKANEGVYQVVSEAGKYAIGADSDQKYMNPAAVIASIKKDAGLAVYTIVKNSAADGTFPGGTVFSAGLADGYLDIVYGSPDAMQQVSDELKAEVENIKQMIIAGKIVVDTAK